MKLFTSLLGLVLLVSCGHNKPPVSPPPGYVSCSVACEHFNALMCGVPLNTCFLVCARVAVNNQEFAKCVNYANDCSAIDTCQ